MFLRKSNELLMNFLFVLLIVIVNEGMAQVGLNKEMLLGTKESADERGGSEFLDIALQLEGDSYRYLEKYDVSEQVLALDKSIDDRTYYLGPGDVLTIYIWGKINKHFNATVSSECKLIIPTVGVIDVKGKTLADAKILVLEKLAQFLKEKEIAIILTQIRNFKAYILGEVKIPGAYNVNGTTRVSDLILLAGGLKIDGLKDEELRSHVISIDSVNKLRAIEIENEYYPKRYADLAEFYNSNIIDKNPYLLEGDRIFVPKMSEKVSAYGAVTYPGVYAYMPGDSLITILRVAGGLTREADSSKVLLYRFVNDVDSLISFEFSFTDSSVYNFPIQKDDRILVCGIPDYRKHRQVTIQGEVKYPGVYPIQKDKTRLSEVIIMAGGLTEDAFLKGSKIVRMEYTKVGDREFERLEKTPPAGLSPLEKSYLKTKLIEEEGIISIDFEELLANGNDFYNIVLRDKDEITIARKNLSIKVTGAVVSPGLVGYKEGADYKYYIAQAGGFTTRARKKSIMIIKGGTETWLKPRKVDKLEAGDAIWVPEKQYVNRLQVTRDVLSILGSLATVLIAAFSIPKLVQ